MTNKLISTRDRTVIDNAVLDCAGKQINGIALLTDVVSRLDNTGPIHRELSTDLPRYAAMQINGTGVASVLKTYQQRTIGNYF